MGNGEHRTTWVIPRTKSERGNKVSIKRYECWRGWCLDSLFLCGSLAFFVLYLVVQWSFGPPPKHNNSERPFHLPCHVALCQPWMHGCHPATIHHGFVNKSSNCIGITGHKSMATCARIPMFSMGCHFMSFSHLTKQGLWRTPLFPFVCSVLISARKSAFMATVCQPERLDMHITAWERKEDYDPTYGRIRS